jgi:2,4-didehydro-3-deoxy-L-rhamnonate hydrolase
MQTVQFSDHGSEKPGIVDAQGVLRDLSAVVPDIDAPSPRAPLKSTS